MRRNSFKTRRFERLEDRRLMAADIDVDNHILQIEGTDNGDEIVITANPSDSGEVLVTIKDRATGQVLEDCDVDIDDFNEIEVHALGGDDVVRNFTDIRAKLFGEAGDDTLESRGGNDEFTGGAGNDGMSGGRGNDTYFFAGTNLGVDGINEAANADIDTLDYSNLGHFVGINLGLSYSGLNLQDAMNFSGTTLRLNTYTAIENVIGSSFDDVITGNSRDNHLMGRDGADRLKGEGGNDTLEGGAKSDIYEFAGSNLGADDIIEAANADSDLLDFRGMSAGLRIDISKAVSDLAVDTADLRLRLKNDTAIERVFGTDYNDTIIGNRRDNVLKGFGGVDSINGLGGADTLDGGASSDVITTDALDLAYGGTGKDCFDGIWEDPARTNPRSNRYLDWGLV
jgi:Ca2+-binding RTX toxin-like protein